ncbi:MAG: hypothetical protein L3J53_04685 [Proteobacteria bacterium]|nr:hypothetical protein [Pseudomonadota bacterium]
MNKIIIIILAATFSLTACGSFLGSKTIADDTDAPNKDYDTVNGSIKVGNNANVGDLSTVNGAIKIASDSQTGEVSTVNGSITLATNVSAKSAETVNGSISLGKNCRIAETVETVNGSVTANSGCIIKGDFETVNGRLTAIKTEIHGNVEMVNGNIYLLDGTIIYDDIVIHKSKGFFNSSNKKPPIVVIGKDVVVKGDLEFERKVKLFVHDKADVDTDVDNVEVTQFSGDEKPYK